MQKTTPISNPTKQKHKQKTTIAYKTAKQMFNPSEKSPTRIPKNAETATAYKTNANTTPHQKTILSTKKRYCNWFTKLTRYLKRTAIQAVTANYPHWKIRLVQISLSSPTYAHRKRIGVLHPITLSFKNT